MKKEQFLEVVRKSMKKEPTEQELSFLGSMGDAVERAFQANLETRKTEIDEALKPLGSFDDGETAAGVIRSLAQKVDDLQKKTERGLSSNEKYKLRSMLEEKKEEIQRGMKGGAPWALEFKAKRAASATMTTTTILTGATAHNTVNLFDDLEVAIFRYPKNFIIDAIGGQQVAKVPEVWRWKEQDTAGVGAVAVTGEGSTKPLVDKKFIWKYSERKKYAGRIEMSEEVEIDFDQLVMDVIAMFEKDVIRAWNEGVLADIIAWVPSYTSSALDGKIVLPTVYSSIGACKVSIQANNYEPDMVFLNPGDAAEAIYLQDERGAQQFIPSDLQFGGLNPFISNQVSQGTVVVGSSQLVREQHSNYIIRKGVYGDQFINNESTIIGELFSALKLPTEYKKGWVQGSIATIKAALQKGV